MIFTWPILSGSSPLNRVFVKSSKLCLLSVAIGLVGAVLCLTPLGETLEEEGGLAWLFALRGETAPPQDIVIISVDQTSADFFKLADDPTDWPREYYAQLIDQINQQHPTLIALNIFFGKPINAITDQQLATAIARDNNVILGSYIKYKTLNPSSGGAAPSTETLMESIELINNAALSAAPFPLPKGASTVKQFWVDKESAGLRTFPDFIFQCYVLKKAYPNLLTLLAIAQSPLATQLPPSFAELAKQHTLSEDLEKLRDALALQATNPDHWQHLLNQAAVPAQQQRLLAAWLNLADHKSLYYNHYGNVGKITTIPFYQALNGLPPDTLRDRIVLVGFSESIEPEKAQGYYTVYSHAHNQTTSPIDLAATALGNLIDNTWLKPLRSAYQFLLLLGWGMLLSAYCAIRSYRLAITVILASGAAYTYFAYYEFVTAAIWLPLTIPLALQMPLVLTAASVIHFRHTNRTKTKMQLALHKLLPKEVVDNIPHQPDTMIMDTSGKLTQGVCLATDVCDYTQLSEALKPKALIDLMNTYYQTVFPLVNQHGGFVTDLAGDGMYAVWAHNDHNQQARSNACQAALAIKQNLAAFNQDQPYPLITRFGLACGEISIGHTGFTGRLIYRAIGDPVNTASRIEALNKQLGTHILVNAAVIADLDDFFLRDVGLFILKGKAKPVHIFELMATQQQASDRDRALTAAFAKALALFQDHQWLPARQAFSKITEQFPNDGPSGFFLRYLENTTKLPEKSVDNQLPMIINVTTLSF